MTSKWARWRLKSPTSQLFTQPFIQGADQRKHQSSASLALVRGIHRWPVNSPHKGPVTRKMFPFDDVIMIFDNHCRMVSILVKAEEESFGSKPRMGLNISIIYWAKLCWYAIVAYQINIYTQYQNQTDFRSNDRITNRQMCWRNWRHSWMSHILQNTFHPCHRILTYM